MIAIAHEALEGPVRMFCGTVLALAFLRWIVWLVDRPLPRESHPDYVSDEWRRERHFWWDPR